MHLKYSDLTAEQKSIICNGCGSKGGWIKPPDFIFKASCNHHDFLYWLGSTEEDRKKADVSFYKYTLDDISKADDIKKPYYHIWALIYYIMVRIFGKKYFYYSDNKRTLKDIQ